MKKNMLTIVAAIIVITGTSFAAEKAVAVNAAGLIKERCSICHSSLKIKSAKKTAKEWEVTVTRMMGKGVKLSAEEKKSLLDYLAKTYKR